MRDQPQLSFACLLDWVEDRLSEEDTKIVNEQLEQASSETQSIVAWLRAFRQISSTTTLDSPPPATHALLVQRFAAYARRQRLSTMRRQIIAMSLFDSSFQPGFSGVRTASGPIAQRHVFYTSEVADLALTILPHSSDQSLAISGQVFPKSDVAVEQFHVHLLRNGDELSAVFADELGEFSFEAIASGVYELILNTDAFDVLIAPVELYM
ncbi:MAG: hypothetical protein MI924_27595 [Chloroflexales bacterium]|nr:hypothetical protein [Chloroflexales bacterium]